VANIGIPRDHPHRGRVVARV